MKNFLTGLVCTCLLVSAWAAPGWAQEQKPVAQAPESAAQPADSQQQTSPPPTAPPPAAPQQEPAAQPQSIIVRKPPAPPPAAPDVRMPGEMGWFVGASGWFPTEQPTFDKGKASTFTNPSKIQFQGKPKIAEGVEVGLAVGPHNILRVAAFESRAAGDTTVPHDVTILTQTYVAGTYVATDYKVQNIKISFEYLTWPYPVESRRIRLKTLWQLQYVSFRSGFDAPFLPTTDSNGTLLLDANGNPLTFSAQQSKWFILPAIGVGVAGYASKHFRIEANVSGFTIPHHDTILDADASANLRIGQIELRVGGKAFHFKTSTAQDFYSHNIMASAFAGIRWYSR